MKDEKLHLIHMLECMERIDEYTSGGREVFMADPKTQDAVLRNFEILGEAAKRVSATIREKSGDIPWRRVAGLRDVLIHQYEGVDLDEVWSIVEKDMPSLKRQIQKMVE